jgi:hypothetical protein
LGEAWVEEWARGSKETGPLGDKETKIVASLQVAAMLEL